MPSLSDRTLFERSWRRLESYVSGKDYAGYCKFDALNSQMLESTFGESKWGRLLSTQIVNRVPLPLRRWTGVQSSRNPKGIANFMRGYCALGFSEPAKELGLWLMANDSASHGVFDGPGQAWGYPFPWQSPAFFAPRHSPNCIVTTFCAEALLDAFQLCGDERFLVGAEGAARYLTEALPVLEDTPERLCIAYVHTGSKWRVVNINAVVAGFLAKFSHATRTDRKDFYADRAKRMVRWVLAARPDGEIPWSYTWPASESGIGPDNYHTGGILDGIFDTMVALKEKSFEKPYLQALDHYRDHFFTGDGAPRWRLDRMYPHDVHGSAQGIITLVRAATLDASRGVAAQKIAAWAVENLQDPETGRFYYQKWRAFTWKEDLMRWNNSWMMRALASLISGKPA